MMKVPRRASPEASSYTPKSQETVTGGVGAHEVFHIGEFFLVVFHARWTNWVSVETVTRVAPIFANRSCCSARAANSVAQTKVKSAG